MLVLDQLIAGVGLAYSHAVDRADAIDNSDADARFEAFRTATFLSHLHTALNSMRKDVREMMPKIRELVPEIDEYVNNVANAMLDEINRGGLPDGYAASIVGASVAITGPDPETLEFGDKDKPGAFPLIGALWAMPPGMEG